MLQIAPVWANFIVTLFAGRIDDEKDSFIQEYLFSLYIAGVDFLSYTFFEGSLCALLVDADTKLKMRVYLIDFEWEKKVFLI